MSYLDEILMSASGWVALVLLAWFGSRPDSFRMSPKQIFAAVAGSIATGVAFLVCGIILALVN